ncbi:unnamed protein product [Schistosoma haematobium]|nr:unnamed protein product [Schistosoma haematobium]
MKGSQNQKNLGNNLYQELLQVYWHERVALDVKLLDLRWLDLRPDSACYEITIFLSRANTSYVYEIINIAYLHAVDLIH